MAKPINFPLQSEEVTDIFGAIRIALACEDAMNDPNYAEYCKRLRKLGAKFSNTIRAELFAEIVSLITGQSI